MGNLWTNEKSLDEFISTCGDITSLAYQIQEHAGNHFDTDPDCVNWSDVGNAKHVKEMLQEVLDFIEGK